MKILVIQTAFIGDVILATAVAEKLQSVYPNSKIDFLLRKGNEQLLANHPFLNEVLIWNKKQNKTRNLVNLILKIRTRKYDYVINLHRFLSSALITCLSGARKTVGFDKSPLSFLLSQKVRHHITRKGGVDDFHETDRNQLLITSLTGSVKALPKLYPSIADVEKVRKIQIHPYVCITPASVWFTKQWPKEKWIELIEALPEVYTVYLLGSSSDQPLCDFIAGKIHSRKVVSLCGHLNLLESAALIEGASMNYVNDSAPLHIASAMNAPVTAIFCSTLPCFGFGPVTDKGFVVQSKEQLPCKPCGLHGKKKCSAGHFKCATSIEIADVLKTLKHSH